MKQEDTKESYTKQRKKGYKGNMNIQTKYDYSNYDNQVDKIYLQKDFTLQP